MSHRPTRAEISLSALQHNYRQMRQLAGKSVEVMAVVKANAYGHGAVACARALAEHGARWFGVTCLSEAVELRQARIGGEILLLSGMFPDEAPAVLAHAVTPAVWEPQQVAALESAATDRSGSATVHVKVDTGMHRLGAAMDALPDLIASLKKAQRVRLGGMFSHFASAESDAAMTAEQARRFSQAIAAFRDAGLSPAICHMNNSAAVSAAAASCHQMVRPGISLYGYSLPLPAGVPAPDLRPVLSLKSAIMQLREVGAGEGLGYNTTFRTQGASRIAALPIGYGDGLNRLLSNRGRVIVRGAYAPIVGRVSMDITLVDVTGIPQVAAGDEVVLIGASGDKNIDAWEHARHCGTIPYEILCNIGPRVPRITVP